MNFLEFLSFVRSEFGRSEGHIPLHEPRLLGNERKYILDALDSNFVSSVGAYVGRFEEMCAAYTGAKYAVATMNGTAALHIALLMAGVKPGEEVVTQPLTFVATSNAIAYTGAKPVFVDVSENTLGLSPKSLQEFLEKDTVKHSDGFLYNRHTNARIAAVVPMHTFGHPAEIDVIAEICNLYNIPLVEDAAESVGSFYKNRHTGTFGLLGILSFNGNKMITTGGGGMILTNNEEIAKKAKHITTTGKVPHAWEFYHDMVAYNYRLINLSAALGCAQMEQAEVFVKAKRRLAERYSEFFTRYKDVVFFTEPENCRSNYWLNTILLPSREERDRFLQVTNENGVMTRPAWNLMHHLPMYKDCFHGKLDTAERLVERIVNIPSSVIPSYVQNR
ncbi:MAG: LegC family aminotransferase [Bacteroidales bacterium]